MTDEELICEFRVSENPVVRELVSRLADTIDTSEVKIAEFEKKFEGVEAKVERLQDKHADRLAALEEKMAHERKRTAELHDEYQQFLAELDRRQSATATPAEKERTMVEQQVEKLTECIVSFRRQQEHTNELLVEILTAIPRRRHPPACTRPGRRNGSSAGTRQD